jgi:hypothetical protein
MAHQVIGGADQYQLGQGPRPGHLFSHITQADSTNPYIYNHALQRLFILTHIHGASESDPLPGSQSYISFSLLMLIEQFRVTKFIP